MTADKNALLRDIYADYVDALQSAVKDGISEKDECARQAAKIREDKAKQRITRITAALAGQDATQIVVNVNDLAKCARCKETVLHERHQLGPHAVMQADEKINAEGRVCPNTLKLCACSVYSPCPPAPAPQDEHHGPFDDPKTADQAPRDIPYIAEVKFNDRTEVVRGVISLPSWPSTPGKE